MHRRGLRRNPSRRAGSLGSALLALRPEMARAVQRVYDDWEHDEEGCDDELGAGGICDRVAEALASVINMRIADVETRDGGADGDDHAWVVALNAAEAYSVDIPARVYESGAGYGWRKRPDVIFEPDDVEIEPLPREWFGEERD